MRSRCTTTPGSEHRYFSSHVIYPEQRNVHGKLFGGWVAAQAFDLASFVAKFFAQGQATVPLGMDEAVFLQPVAVSGLTLHAG